MRKSLNSIHYKTGQIKFVLVLYKSERMQILQKMLEELLHSGLKVLDFAARNTCLWVIVYH